MKTLGLFFVLGLVLFTNITAGAATFTWQGGTGIWTDASNWSPARNTPASTDILQFNDGNTYSITSVGTETIGSLLVSNGTIINLQSSGAATLTVSGGAGAFSVAFGTSLNINGTGTNALTIAVASGSTGSISGNMTFANAAHKLTAGDASGITFNSPANFTQGTGCLGNVFGAGISNSIVFGTGTRFIQNDGSNPFAKTQPSSVVVFQTGSLFRVTSSAIASLSFSGRTYADLEWANSGSPSQGGSNKLNVDNLTISSGSVTVVMTGTGANISSIKGNISISSGASLILSGSGTSLQFNGSSTQSISGSGSLNIGLSQTISIPSSKSVNLQKSITLDGTLTVDGQIDAGANVISGSGTFTLSSGATLKTAHTSGIPGAVTCTTKTFSSSANYEFNGSSAQVTGSFTTTPTAATVNDLTISNTTGVTLSSNLNVTTALINTGILDVSTYTLSAGAITNSTGMLRFSGTNNGLALNAGMVEYNGTNQTIKTGTYASLNLTGTGTKTAEGNITVTSVDNGGASNTASVLDMAGYILTATSIDNTGATVKFSGASNGKAISTGTVEYYGITQNIEAGTYNNLTTSGTLIKTLSGAIVVNGVLNIGSPTELNTSGSGYAISLSGNFINNGVFTGNGGTVTFAGSTAISGSTTSTFNNVNISGTLIAPSTGLNIAGNFVNNGSFTHNSGLVSFTGTSTISGSATTTFNNLSIYGSLTGHAGTMNVNGNWSQFTGSYTHNSGTVVLSGTSNIAAQSITGTNTFYNLSMNNSGMGVLLNSNNTTIANTLTLTSGIVNTDVYNLNVSNTASGAVSGGSSSAYIKGKLNRGIAAGASTYAFPVGTSTYAPVSISFSSSNGGTLTGETFDMDSPNINTSNLITNQSVNRYWNFTKTGLSSVAYGASFNWAAGDRDGSFDYTTAVCGKYDGSSWSYPAISNRMPTSASISGATGFSEFQFGDQGNLPVELSSFDAVKSGKYVDLSWETASERDNDKFIIERSGDAKNFVAIAEVKGAGNASTANSYNYADLTPLPGTSYYRLKQVDFNGMYTYSIIRSVSFEEKAGYVLFPTLAKDKLTLKSISDDDTETFVQLISLANNIIIKQTAIPPGEHYKDLDISGISPGSYVARLVSGQHVQSLKFMKL